MQTVAKKTEEIRNLRINSIPVRITNREITTPHHNKNTNNYVTRKCANTQKRSWSNNLIHIRKENLVRSSTNSFHFVPVLLLSYTMSLAPKIDEIAYTIKQKNLDLALFTETWLKESIPDQSIKITGYQLFPRDRKNGSHGGVCAFVKDSIECKTLLDLHDDDDEILWLLLRPKRLPRGFSNIVVAVIYHPPTADNTTLRDHLKNSLECVEADYPHSAVILAGDFNKLDFRIPAKCFQLKPTVNFPTRGANILDQVFTNLKNYYTQPVRGPPFGLSDHVRITIFPETRSRTESQRKLIKVRDKRQSKVASLGRYLINIPWEDLLSSDQTVD